MRHYWGCLLGGLVAVCLLAGAAGCAPGTPCWNWAYAAGTAAGEMLYLSRAVPIEQGLSDPNLTQEQKDKLAFVIEARDYAEGNVGLNVNTSYRTFVNLEGQTLAWNLSVSRADAIEAYVWNLPVVGPISYLGFFDYNELVAERDRLRNIGYDTFSYELDAFSTLGLLPDPVASALLKRSLDSLGETVMHELTHNTVWAANDVVYSESLASFVGKTAGLEFLANKFGSDSQIIVQANNTYEDEDRINAFLLQMVAELQALYAEPISREEKLGRREPIFQAGRDRFVAEVQPTLHEPKRYSGYGTYAYNNAFLLVNVRYNNDPKIFNDVYERNSRSWSASLAVFNEAAHAANPYGYLRNYLGS